MPTLQNQIVEALIKSAETHGLDSEPDHEVGDLQDYLRAAFTLLTPEQAQNLLTLEAVKSTFEAATGVELDAKALVKSATDTESTESIKAGATQTVDLFMALFTANFVLVDEYEI